MRTRTLMKILVTTLRRRSPAGVIPRRPLAYSSGLLFVCLLFTSRHAPPLINVIVAWTGTLTLTVLQWRSGSHTRPRDPPFTHPAEPLGDIEDDGDEESQYNVIPPARRTTSDGESPNPFADTNRYSAASAAPSAGAYSGVSTNAPSSAPGMPRPSMDAYGAFSDPAPTGYGDTTPRVSRTMQYADPYAAVRSSIAGSTAPAANTPPSYEGYQGYR